MTLRLLAFSAAITSSSLSSMMPEAMNIPSSFISSGTTGAKAMITFATMFAITMS